MFAFPTGFTEAFPSLQVEAGTDRQHDSDILVEALAEIGVNKKDMAKRTNSNKQFLEVMIGPKPR